MQMDESQSNVTANLNNFRLKAQVGAVNSCGSQTYSTQIPLIAHKHHSTCSTAAHSDKNGAINYKIHPTQI
jgi:hypothetical protein